jgi:hypothetical protein
MGYDLDKITELPQSENLDPAPHPVDVAHQRSAQLMDNLTSQALDQLRQFRDDTDALMVALNKRHDAIVSAIDEHASRVASVIEAKKIMAEQTQKMKEMFAPVQAVITEQRS